MGKEITFAADARRRMQSGADQLADVVKGTLGPLGRSVVLEGKPPQITDDGAAAVKELEPEDALERTGARILREAAAKTAALTGDGSATAIVLAQSILRDGLRNIAAGAAPLELRKGILGAAQVACAAVQKIARPVNAKDEIARVAEISAGDPEIAELVAESLTRVGKEGVVTVEESPGFLTTLEVKDGMQLERGALFPLLAAGQDGDSEDLKEPYILVTDFEIADPQLLLPVLEKVSQTGAPLLIVAEKLEGAALGLLTVNKRKGTLNAVAVHPPAYGDGRVARMEDIAVFTGGTFVSRTMGHQLKDVTLEMLGRAKLVSVDAKDTVIIGGYGDRDAVAARISYIKMLLEKSAYDFDRERLKERLAKFVSGVAVIRAGANTETEMREKKRQAEAALCAARAAMEEGAVPGGGVALLLTRPAVQAYANTLSEDRRTGALVLIRALEAPLRQIAENAGFDSSAAVAKVLQMPAGTGLDVRSGAYVNLLEAGITDPAKVTRLALQNAASAAAVLLTAEAAVEETGEPVEPDA